MLAGRNAFSMAFVTGPKILEPSDVVVSIPGEYMGDVMSDLQDAAPRSWNGEREALQLRRKFH